MTGTLAAAAAPVASAADGTLVVLAVAGIWVYALRGKGTLAGRLAAVVCFGIACWLILGAANPAGATAVASGTVNGVSAVFSALGVILKAA